MEQLFRRDGKSPGLMNKILFGRIKKHLGKEPRKLKVLFVTVNNLRRECETDGGGLSSGGGSRDLLHESGSRYRVITEMVLTCHYGLSRAGELRADGVRRPLLSHPAWRPPARPRRATAGL